MYEEQELTMQVFSEPEISTNESDVIVSLNAIQFKYNLNTMFLN